jgi:ABC-2 family transporter protein
MTAITAPAPPATRPRPVPWTRLVWVTWRQHRVALAGVTVLLGGVGLYLLIMGLKIHSGYASVTSCRPAGSAACQLTRNLVTGDYYPTAQTMTGFLQVIPVLVGVFVGGPVLARELQTGTFRFAWTQGCGRARWVIAKLALLAVTVTVAAEAFSLLFTWYFQPWFAQGLDGGLAPQLFDLRGVDFAAWTLLAFALGVAAGALIRRTVPAMAAAIAAWTGIFFATFMFLRKYYQAPLVAGNAKASSPGFANNWSWAQWYNGPNGKPVSQQTVENVMARAPASVQNSKNPNVGSAYLAAHHYTQWWTYQPVSRYWHFQFIEGGWLLALSLILFAGTVWLVRAKAA